jgi:hypothetical protein
MHDDQLDTRRFPEKIISGGQTGVDRGALDAAIALGIPHGGWCPRGRLAEDGSIPDVYQLAETDLPDYPQRTERNVLESDGTLILCHGAPVGGTELTRRLATRYGKPCLVANLDTYSAADILAWLASANIRVLNVAGPRESQSPGIAAETQRLLVALFGER